MNRNRRPSSEALWLLGSNLKRLREARGYSQIELGRRSGLENSKISKIEQAQGNASLALLDALAKGLDCSLQDLFIPITEPASELAMLGAFCGRGL